MASYTKSTILQAIVGTPSPSLGDNFPSTQCQILSFWLWIEKTERGDSKKTPDKANVLDKVLEEVINHGRTNGIYQELNDDQEYTLRVRVRRLIKAAEKIGDSFGTKQKNVDGFIAKHRKKFKNSFDFDLTPNEKLQKV